jgi:hypothetical protein
MARCQARVAGRGSKKHSSVQRESDVLSDVMTYLTIRQLKGDPLMYWRNNTGAGNVGGRWLTWGAKGSPDNCFSSACYWLAACVFSRAVWLT